MKICFIGKFPPIQGGVSARTYWLAHHLAERGHEIYVVTNAKETSLPFRLYMNLSDWEKCEKNYPSGGFVKVFWTKDDYDTQYHIPWSNPFVTKLSTIAINVIQKNNIDLIFSYYLEPYGVVGYICKQVTKKPLVLKHAGSDIGRLWNHEQFHEFYNEIIKSADALITSTRLKEKFQTNLECKTRFFTDISEELPSIFNTKVKPANIREIYSEIKNSENFSDLLSGSPTENGSYIGIYGKFSEYKGICELINAFSNTKRSKFKLLIIGKGKPKIEDKIEKLIKDKNLQSWIIRLPFLPNWRMPSIIKACKAVCFLENDFPIKSHIPFVAREVWACGIPLIVTKEVVLKQPLVEELIHNYNCMIINDVKDSRELEEKLTAVIENKFNTFPIGLNGSLYYKKLKSQNLYPGNYEKLFSSVICKNNFKEIILDKNHPSMIVQDSREINFSEKFPVLSYQDFLDNFQFKKNSLDYLSQNESEIVKNFLKLENQLLNIKELEVVKNNNIESFLFRMGSSSKFLNNFILINQSYQKNESMIIETYEYDVSEMLNRRHFGIFNFDISRKKTNLATYIIPDNRGTVIAVVPDYFLKIFDTTKGKVSGREIIKMLLESDDKLSDGILKLISILKLSLIRAVT